MAPPRAFDYALLERLLFENQGWSAYEFAKALTEDNRRTDPDSPAVKVGTVTACISKHRQEWEGKRGAQLARKWEHYDLYALPAGVKVHPGHRMDQPMRHLRVLSRIASGAAVSGTADADNRRQALDWERGRRARREVVDLTAAGVPIIRPASNREINADGDLISLVAWQVPGWRGGQGRGKNDGTAGAPEEAPLPLGGQGGE